MADILPSNHILRRVAERRKRAEDDLKMPPNIDRTMEATALHYAYSAIRYNILDELYDEIAELLKQGDDLD